MNAALIATDSPDTQVVDPPALPRTITSEPQTRRQMYMDGLSAALQASAEQRGAPMECTISMKEYSSDAEDAFQQFYWANRIEFGLTLQYDDPPVSNNERRAVLSMMRGMRRIAVLNYPTRRAA